MWTRLVALTSIGALALAPCVVALEDHADPELEQGIQQAQIGDFEKAVVTLDSVARRLEAEGGRSRELARAYVYLSISYLGLSQEQKAKAQFLEALRADRDMEIDQGEFPPRILEFFEEAREEAESEGVVEPTPAAPEPAPEEEAVSETSAAAGEPEEKGGSAKWLLIGGGAAAAAGVALAAGGGGGDSGGSAAAPPAPPEPVVQWIEVWSNDVPKEIPDENQAFSQLTNTQGGTIVEAFLEFRISHTCRLDLWMELRHPDGSVWQQAAPADCGQTWEGPLGFEAAGLRAHGVWSLTVMDRFDGDSGTLEAWGLRLRVER